MIKIKNLTPFKIFLYLILPTTCSAYLIDYVNGINKDLAFILFTIVFITIIYLVPFLYVRKHKPYELLAPSLSFFSLPHLIAPAYNKQTTTGLVK